MYIYNKNMKILTRDITQKTIQTFYLIATLYESLFLISRQLIIIITNKYLKIVDCLRDIIEFLQI